MPLVWVERGVVGRSPGCRKVFGQIGQTVNSTSIEEKFGLQRNERLFGWRTKDPKFVSVAACRLFVGGSGQKKEPICWLSIVLKKSG